MRRFPLYPIVMTLLLAVAAPAAMSATTQGAAAPAAAAVNELPDGASGSSLTAIREGSRAGAYHLVCRGECEHRLVQTADLMTVVVELPHVANAVAPGAVPGPRGAIGRIEVDGEHGDGTQVRFTLLEPARAMSRPEGEGLELRIDPGTDGAHQDGAVEHPVGPEDLLEIAVFEIPELTRTVRVSERGTISLPLLGEMQVQGLTLTQLEGRLRDELGRNYLKDPQVSVFVREYGSKKVSIIGAVGRPGVYEMLGPRTLLQVLSQAGGLQEGAGAEIFVVCNSDGEAQKRVAINLADLMANRDQDLNVPIHPGDIVTVPLDRMVYVYVDGAVRRPGRIDQLESRPISLLQAIAKAGGATERANLKEIQILRKRDDGMQALMQINLKRVRKGKATDPMLQDGDIVVVPETFF